MRTASDCLSLSLYICTKFVVEERAVRITIPSLLFMRLMIRFFVCAYLLDLCFVCFAL